jgi:mycolic acid cyclopropane synthetase
MSDNPASATCKRSNIDDVRIEIQSEEVYERYMKYMTGCAGAFRTGYIDCNQFTLEKQKEKSRLCAGVRASGARHPAR